MNIQSVSGWGIRDEYEKGIWHSARRCHEGKFQQNGWTKHYLAKFCRYQRREKVWRPMANYVAGG